MYIYQMLLQDKYPMFVIKFFLDIFFCKSSRLLKYFLSQTISLQLLSQLIFLKKVRSPINTFIVCRALRALPTKNQIFCTNNVLMLVCSPPTSLHAQHFRIRIFYFKISLLQDFVTNVIFPGGHLSKNCNEAINCQTQTQEYFNTSTGTVTSFIKKVLVHSMGRGCIYWFYQPLTILKRSSPIKTNWASLNGLVLGYQQCFRSSLLEERK